MDFLTEPEPPRGVAVPVAPGVRRIVARNAGPMTYWGTNTYLLDRPDGVAVLDPGPEDAVHVGEILRAAGGAVRAILLTHTHPDHLGAVASLRAATGAPVHAYSRPAGAGFAPDRLLDGGDWVAGLVALHMPGHAPDHLCFATESGLLFSGDHVMGWSSTVVSPPDGDMAAYMAGLERLLGRADIAYLPGHGPILADPGAFVHGLLAHRRAREEAIVSLLAQGRIDGAAILDHVYGGLDPRLRGAALRNIEAHLRKLEGEGRAMRDGAGWRRA